MLNKTIWILWLQGWDDAPWLIKQIAESWEINNPDWKVEYLTLNNVHQYVDDIDYLYDQTKDIEPQHKADIIRLSLLKNHGGVWADATMLCMQPLSSWVEEAVKPAGLWMYHGSGGGMPKHGPAIWFIVSEKDSLIINKWKNACDEYWHKRTKADNNFWLDGLFKQLFASDREFQNKWDLVPYLYGSAKGQASAMSGQNFQLMVSDNQELKKIFRETPPYALKFWWRVWQAEFSDINSPKCQNSTGYYAIQMSKRRFIYKHKMADKDYYMNLVFWAERWKFKLVYLLKENIKNLLKSLKIYNRAEGGM
ncbi:capsular polysaccharide synthesis protein [Nostoc sp. TCL26-01]|uniref:capsular polysaccharide synthesis protein n=1 Tax=Nostoc sp. TCL26-01 TaxID=2576904 RepID=UPI0015BD78C3|nr:capsular polysaccharide synthesis protein [Nostoc sp. TCL26-01]QLE58181.1 hypothetical protein FD725_23280 [Nostoc sp. TCL26-01]